jgi:hypothetical protein
MKEKILELYGDDELLLADGFDDAIIGFDEQGWRVIYSVRKCIDILMKDMGELEAIEYFAYNVSGAYLGEKTPIWCYDLGLTENI